ncbi:hypothetical protein GCM10010320_47880 [Streptomyces caelestis]|nr:hypothetical protein GCM10010320_47880 [Streptomyces caelestis]
MPLLKYEQIADDLRTRIANGEFGPGELLPSGRDLAEQWSVSRATVVKAYDVLRADGLVVARQGAGSSRRRSRVLRADAELAQAASRAARRTGDWGCLTESSRPRT